MTQQENTEMAKNLTRISRNVCSVCTEKSVKDLSTRVRVELVGPCAFFTSKVKTNSLIFFHEMIFLYHFCLLVLCSLYVLSTTQHICHASVSV